MISKSPAINGSLPILLIQICDSQLSTIKELVRDK